MALPVARSLLGRFGLIRVSVERGAAPAVGKPNRMRMWFILRREARSSFDRDYAFRPRSSVMMV